MSGLSFERFGAAIGEAAGEEAAGETAGLPVDLPAFLPSKDYTPFEYGELKSGQEIAFDVAEGGTAFYIGRIQARLTHGSEGKIYLNFSGVEFPPKYSRLVVDSPGTSTSKWSGEETRVDFPEDGIPLPEGLEITISQFLPGPFVNYREFTYVEPHSREFDIYLPRSINLPDKSVEVLELGYRGIRLGVDGRQVTVRKSDTEETRVLVPKNVVGVEAGAEVEVSAEKRMAGAIRELMELGKNREVPDLGRRAGKAVAELLTAMVEAGPGLTTKMAGAALRKENPTDEDMLMFFGRVAGMAIKMRAEIADPAPDTEKSLSASLRLLVNLSDVADSPQRQEVAGAAFRQFLTDLSRVDAETRDKLVAAGLNKKPEELTEEDMLIFFGRLVGTAVALKAKM